MITTDRRSKLLLEFMLINIVLGMTMLFVIMCEHRLLALNLFYLPVIVSGYFLGRFCAGVLALFSALLVTIATLVFPTHFVALDSAVGVALALTLWSAILGLAAIVVGTLCDERAATVMELHRAYVGIAEVLSRYLQGFDPKRDSRTRRVACLSQRIAEELRLPARDVDDIRVAALLHDLGNLEISTQVISRAVSSVESESAHNRRTFMGTDLVHSLGEVLQGALPLLVNQDDGVYNLVSQQRNPHEIPLGGAHHPGRANFRSDGLRIERPAGGLTEGCAPPYARRRGRTVPARDRRPVADRGHVRKAVRCHAGRRLNCSRPLQAAPVHRQRRLLCEDLLEAGVARTPAALNSLDRPAALIGKRRVEGLAARGQSARRDVADDARRPA